MKNEYRLKVVFRDGNSCSFIVNAETFLKAVYVALSSYPDFSSSRFVSFLVEET